MNVPAAPDTIGPATASDPAGARTQSEPAGARTQSDVAGTRAQADRTRDRAERTARPSQRAGTGFGWLDELAASWGYLAVIGATLLVLAEAVEEVGSDARSGSGSGRAAGCFAA
jgi:hypothetical protein